MLRFRKRKKNTNATKKANGGNIIKIWSILEDQFRMIIKNNKYEIIDFDDPKQSVEYPTFKHLIDTIYSNGLITDEKEFEYLHFSVP